MNFLINLHAITQYGPVEYNIVQANPQFPSADSSHYVVSHQPKALQCRTISLPDQSLAPNLIKIRFHQNSHWLFFNIKPLDFANLSIRLNINKIN